MAEKPYKAFFKKEILANLFIDSFKILDKKLRG
jgi:hypothetical protein